MARTFDITASATVVEGSGDLSFTVANTGSPVRGRAELVPLGATKTDWLRVQGEPVRDFPANGVHQFTLTVAPPSGAPPGDHRFRLDMVNVNDPDEDYTEGQEVTIRLKRSNNKVKGPIIWPFIVGGVVLLLLIGGVVWWMSSRGVAVPDVVGKPLEEATALLEEKGLVGEVAEVEITGKEIGTVLRQWPKAGQQASRESSVELAVEAESVEVPAVTDQLFEEAKTVLEEKGLEAEGSEQRITGGAPSGTVLYQSPEEGEKVPLSTAVELIVEAKSVKVPDVVGKPLDQAIVQLTGQGLTIGELTTTLIGDGPDNTVSKQEPAANERVYPATSVALEVRGERPAPPPLLATPVQLFPEDGARLGTTKRTPAGPRRRTARPPGALRTTMAIRTLATCDVTLEWETVPDAISYGVRVDRFDTSQKPRASQKQGHGFYKRETKLSQTSYKVPVVRPGKYRWRVWATGKDGNTSAKSGWWDFACIQPKRKKAVRKPN
jgi:beta-lactam-binding protein with PASTA domain